MEIQIAQDRSFAKRNSPFFVKDILGLSDESETESSDEMNRESGNEEMNEYVDDLNNNGKKTRQCFTSKQVEELEKLFNETNYPDAYTRQMLAKKMKVSETRIQIWCQNRRAKIRRQRKQRKPILSGISGPHGIYYPSSSPWLQPHFTSLLPFPVLPLHRSSLSSPIREMSPEKSRIYYRTDFNKDDLSISDYARSKQELQELHGRLRSYTR